MLTRIEEFSVGIVVVRGVAAFHVTRSAKRASPSTSLTTHFQPWPLTHLVTIPISSFGKQASKSIPINKSTQPGHPASLNDRINTGDDTLN